MHETGGGPARERAARAALVLLALLVASFVAGTFLVPALADPDRGDVLALRWIYAPLCHQFPERSLALGSGHQAVCARCSGLYLGAATALLVAACLPFAALRRPRPSWLALAALPTLVDVVLHVSGGPSLGNLPRLLAAWPPGFLAGLFLADAVRDLFVQGAPRPPRARRSIPQTLVVEEADG